MKKKEFILLQVTHFIVWLLATIFFTFQNKFVGTSLGVYGMWLSYQGYIVYEKFKRQSEGERP